MRPISRRATAKPFCRDRSGARWRCRPRSRSQVLHDIVVQITMGGSTITLWEFTIGGRTCGLAMDKDWARRRGSKRVKVRARDMMKPLGALADPEHPDHAEVAGYLDGLGPKESDGLPLRITLGCSAPTGAMPLGTRIAKTSTDHDTSAVGHTPRPWPDGYGSIRGPCMSA